MHQPLSTRALHPQDQLASPLPRCPGLCLVTLPSQVPDILTFLH